MFPKNCFYATLALRDRLGMPKSNFLPYTKYLKLKYNTDYHLQLTTDVIHYHGFHIDALFSSMASAAVVSGSIVKRLLEQLEMEASDAFWFLWVEVPWFRQVRKSLVYWLVKKVLYLMQNVCSLPAGIPEQYAAPWLIPAPQYANNYCHF